MTPFINPLYTGARNLGEINPGTKKLTAVMVESGRNFVSEANIIHALFRVESTTGYRVGI